MWSDVVPFEALQPYLSVQDLRAVACTDDLGRQLVTQSACSQCRLVLGAAPLRLTDTRSFVLMDDALTSGRMSMADIQRLGRHVSLALSLDPANHHMSEEEMSVAWMEAYLRRPALTLPAHPVLVPQGRLMSIADLVRAQPLAPRSTAEEH